MMTERVETWCYQRRSAGWLSGIHQVHVQCAACLWRDPSRVETISVQAPLVHLQPVFFFIFYSHSSYLMAGLSVRTREEQNAKPVQGAVRGCVQQCGVRRRMYVLRVGAGTLRTLVQLLSHVLVSSLKRRSSS